MGKLLHPDSSFSKIMTKLFDACLLNLLWLVCSIPIFTIGPATQALYYVALKHAEGEDGSITRRYFKAFQRCFGQSVGIGLIMLGSGGLILLDIYLSHIAETALFHNLLPIFLILLFFWSCILMYVFAVQARFDDPIRVTFKIAAGLALQHFPKTIIMLMTSLILSSLIYFAPILLIVNVGLIPMINAGLLLKAFAPYLPAAAAAEEHEFPDSNEGMAMNR